MPHICLPPSIARPIGNAANMSLSTLFRWTHPTIYNMKRYSEQERIVPGGLVLAATIGASSRGLFEMLHEQIEHCAFLNKVGTEAWHHPHHGIRTSYDELQDVVMLRCNAMCCDV